MRRQLALRFQRLKEGLICKTVLSGSLVTHPCALIVALLEEGVRHAPRLFPGGDRTSRMTLGHRIGKGQRCDHQQKAQCNDDQDPREKRRPMTGAERHVSDRARAPLKHPPAKVCTPQEKPGKEENQGP